jgi:hypothetical protein
MSQSAEKARVLEEISLIPEDRLSEIYQLLHYFRLGLEASRGRAQSVMRFAGCWRNMPDATFEAFMKEVSQRRHQAFLGRRANDAGNN